MINRCKLIIFFLFSFVLSGCNNDSLELKTGIDNNSIATSVSNSRTKLRWLAQWQGQGDKEKLIREIAREFSFLNQDIDLQVDFPPDVIKNTDASNLFKSINDTIARMVHSKVWT